MNLQGTVEARVEDEGNWTLNVEPRDAVSGPH